MHIHLIEADFLKNRQKHVKRYTFKTGSHADAEDIVQEAYCRALRYRHSFHGDGFDKWFSTILNNCFFDFKNQQGDITGEEYDESSIEGLGCPLYSDQIMREIFELIATKSLMQQEVLTLFFEMDYTPVDISRCTPHSYSNCHQIIRRFRQELKDLYQ